MTKTPINSLIDDINNRIDYWRKEASLTYAETIGALELIKHDLINEAQDENEETT